MTTDRQTLLRTIEQAEPATLPQLAGLLAEAQATLTIRLAQGRPVHYPGGTDRNLSAKEAALRLGISLALALQARPRVPLHRPPRASGGVLRQGDGDVAKVPGVLTFRLVEA